MSTAKKIIIGTLVLAIIVAIIIACVLFFKQSSSTSTPSTGTVTPSTNTPVVTPSTNTPVVTPPVVTPVPTIAPFKKLDNGDISGFDISTTPVGADSFDDCAAHCDTTSGCSFFVYNTNNKSCWLKKTASNSAVKTMWNTDLPFESSAQINGDIPGFDIPGLSGATDLKTCYNSCKANNTCQWINYNNGTCYPKKVSLYNGAQVGLRLAGEK